MEESELSRRLRVFLCHASGDKDTVRDLYQRLRADGTDPWLDEEKLLPGQDWELEIKRAVRSSDAVVVCLSPESTTKAGYVHKEIKYALDVAEQQPERAIFLIPLKLEECEVPERLRHRHWVNLFQESGYDKLRRALQARAKELGITWKTTHVNLQVGLNKAHFSAAQESQLAYVLVEVTPEALLANASIPINLCIVIERSRALAGQKLSDVKAATKLAVDQMTPRDILSIVVFDDSANAVVPAQRVADSMRLKQRVDAIGPGSSSRIAISRGMRKGLNELRKALNPIHVNRMLLFVASETSGDEDECRSLAKEAAAIGAPIMALGLGEDWNMALLDSIAQISGSNSDFIPDGQPQIILNVFQPAIQAFMGRMVVQHAEMVLRTVPEVLVRRAWRVTPLTEELDFPSLSDRHVRAKLQDLDGVKGQKVLVELLLPAFEPGRYRLGQVEISYDNVFAGIFGEKAEADIVGSFTSDRALANQADLHVMNIVEKATAHKP